MTKRKPPDPIAQAADSGPSPPAQLESDQMMQALEQALDAIAGPAAAGISAAQY